MKKSMIVVGALAFFAINAISIKSACAQNVDKKEVKTELKATKPCCKQKADVNATKPCCEQKAEVKTTKSCCEQKAEVKTTKSCCEQKAEVKATKSCCGQKTANADSTASAPKPVTSCEKAHSACTRSCGAANVSSSNSNENPYSDDQNSKPCSVTGNNNKADKAKKEEPKKADLK